jgi:phosphoglycolate phosphatase-like HAD superfamily hydrolase
MLGKMKEAGISLGVITSRKRSEYDAEPLMKQLEPYIEVIVCSDNTPRPKPDGAPIETYCKLCGITPSEMIYIGDTYNDFMCARNGGCDFGLSQLGIVEKEKIEADYYFDSAEDMIKTLI